MGKDKLNRGDRDFNSFGSTSQSLVADRHETEETLIRSDDYVIRGPQHYRSR